MVINFSVQSRSLVFYSILSTVFRRLILIFLIYFIQIFESQVLNFSNIFLRYDQNLKKRQTKNNNYKKSFLFLGLLLNLKRKAYIQHVSTSKNSLNQLFHHIWLFRMARKLFLACAAAIVGRLFLIPLLCLTTFLIFCRTPFPPALFVDLFLFLLFNHITANALFCLMIMWA